VWGWIEAVALLPCTLFLVPLMFYGSIGLMFGIIGIWRTARGTGMGSMFFLLAQMWAGIAGLAAVWLPLVIGIDRTRQKPALRRSILILLVVGLADASHFLLGSKASAEITSSLGSMVMWAAVLGLPMAVGGRYFCLLLRG
jgi:hypothetical protein